MATRNDQKNLPIRLLSIATRNNQKISLKLMVDRERNRVVFAESNQEFVDILFSFLTMPMGTIVRLLAKQSQPAELGSLTTLYKALADFDTNLLWTETCKSMLLHPRNSAENLCRKLKLNIDDSEPTKYFLCANTNCRLFCQISYSSDQRHARCSCLNFMSREVKFKEHGINVGTDGDLAFVKENTKFMITDDLQVMPTSTASICDLLNKLGISNMNVLDTKTVNIGLQEISHILHFSLFSPTPMTDIFLRDQTFPLNNVNIKQHNLHLPARRDAPSSLKQITIKLILRRSNNVALYAEAGDDFVDLLFSFLTIPLGSVVSLFNGNSLLGCIDNLYRSVTNMNTVQHIASEDCKSILLYREPPPYYSCKKRMLLYPKLPPYYSCKNQLLDVKEVNDMPYCYTEPVLGCNEYPFLTYRKNDNIKAVKLTFIDPNLPAYSSSSSRRGYVKGPAMFMVRDNLTVELLSTISTIDLLTKLNVPITNLEEREICVGKEEALCLLKASLISNKALNVGLNLG